MTFTAQILIGQSHTYDGGIINIRHMLFLSEHDSPAWVISPLDVFGINAKSSREQNIVWIPTVENMLEDGLLMYGIYVLKDERLVEMAKEYLKNSDSSRVELYRDIDPDKLNLMYQRLQGLESHNKLIVSVFNGSSISSQLEVLKKYKMEVEVTEPTFVREYNP